MALSQVQELPLYVSAPSLDPPSRKHLGHTTEHKNQAKGLMQASGCVLRGITDTNGLSKEIPIPRRAICHICSVRLCFS